MEFISAILLLLTAATFTGLTRFVQLRRFVSALCIPFRNTRKAKHGGVSPFEAAATSLAATIGTGNIAGVGGAILLGGPGAVFWMWVSSFLGMALKYAEIVLSLRFSGRDGQGAPVGGPMILFRRALPRGGRILAAAFSGCGAAVALGMGNLVQSNTVADGVAGFLAALGMAPGGLPFSRLVTGCILAALLYSVLLGGAQRVGRWNAVLVPVMSALYLTMSIFHLCTNGSLLPAALRQIILCALQPASVLGGAAGITVRAAFRVGISRGVFTHEAGLGTAGIAHGGAEGVTPRQQGLFGIFEVFFDGLICTVTALVILTSGISLSFGSSENMAPVAAAFSATFGAPLASGFLALSLALFAFSSMVSFAYYGARCTQDLLGAQALSVYRPVFALFTVLGAVFSGGFVWDAAELMNALMAVPNLIGMVWIVRRHGPRILE